MTSLYVRYAVTSLAIVAGCLGYTAHSHANAPAAAPAQAQATAAEAALPAFVTLPPVYIEHHITLKRNQSLNQRLRELGLSFDMVRDVTRTLQKQYDLRRMNPGQEIVVRYKEAAPGEAAYIEELFFHTKNDKTIRLGWEADTAAYQATVTDRFITRERAVATGVIEDSLYRAATRANLPAALVAPFANLFAWELDFTRDIRPGNRFRVIYERIYDEKGEFLRAGDILAAELDTGKVHNAFRVIHDGDVGYYDESGHNKRRALLRTPLEFMRISSHFNPRRKHPVLGYTRAHKGTDFAAPTGTPIKASGDGVVERANWYGGYGRYVRIRHDNTFNTAYAHLSRFARGIKAGKRVKQGQIIGYVGMSGTATGPHLHYEVLKNNRQVNALKVDLPKGKALPKAKRNEFKSYVAEARMLWQDADPKMVAQAQ